jgi:hypothetical protein
MRHDVRGMEDYVAADQRPLERCLQDVAACDLYVGIFAWRYGYVPKVGNPERRSITELEYRHAGELHKPRLIFLLSPDAPWPTSAVDAITGEEQAGARIKDLRNELMGELLVSLFTNADDLANKVSVAVYLQLEGERSINAAMVEATTALPEALLEALLEPTLGMSPAPTSGVSDISDTVVDSIHQATSARLLEVNIGGGKSWWSTRLFLLAAVAAEFTAIEQLVFVGEGRQFLGLAATQSTRFRLSDAFPQLAELYARVPSLALQRASSWSQADLAAETVESFAEAIADLPDGQTESDLKEWVTPQALARWLGSDLRTDTLESLGQPVTARLLHHILKRGQPFVVLTHDGRLVGVIDRRELASDVATSLLERQLVPNR